MSRCIYSKYSNERRKELATRTEIHEMDDGSRVVRKFHLYPEGEPYVSSMVRTEQALSERFRNSRGVSIQKARAIEGGVEFTYVEGEPLHSVFDRMVEAGDRNTLENALKNYIETIVCGGEETAFRVTADFTRVFDETEDTVKEWIDSPAVAVPDIDMIPTNIIVNGDKGTVIDYEWTFLFPLPKAYLTFRTILFWYAEANGNTLFTWEELRSMFGFSEQNEHTFRRWEDHFQKWILGGKVPVWQLNSAMSGRIIGMDELLYVQQLMKQKEMCKVWFDFGKGYETPPLSIPRWAIGDGRIATENELTDCPKSIRIKVTSARAICYVAHMEVNGRDKLYKDTTGKVLSDDLIANVEGDLYITVTVPPDVAREDEPNLFKMTLFVMTISDSAEDVYDLTQLIEKNRYQEKLREEMFMKREMNFARLLEDYENAPTLKNAARKGRQLLSGKQGI